MTTRQLYVALREMFTFDVILFIPPFLSTNDHSFLSYLEVWNKRWDIRSILKVLNTMHIYVGVIHIGTFYTYDLRPTPKHQYRWKKTLTHVCAKYYLDKFLPSDLTRYIIRYGY